MADDSTITVNAQFEMPMPTSEEVGEELAGRLGALEYMVAVALAGYEMVNGPLQAPFRSAQGGKATSSAFVEAEKRVLNLRDELRRRVRAEQQTRE